MNHEEKDHDNHSMHGDFKKKFFISLIIGLPILLIAPMMGFDLPFQISFPGSEWVVLILSTILFIYGGSPFLKGAKNELSDKSPGMMTLISLGISVAYFYSLYAFAANRFFQVEGEVIDFSWELASLILIMLLGHWIEMRAVSSAGNALEKMAELLPSHADLIKNDGSIEEVSIEDLNKGDRIRVKAGKNFPVDGKVIQGSSTANEAMITGESLAVEKTVGDQVIGGSINGNGTLNIKVEGIGKDAYLSKIMDLVKTAQEDKSKTENLSEKIAKYLFYIAVSVGLAAFVIWFVINRDLNSALLRMVTVLVIACPHALGLAIPLVVARSTSLAAQNGLLIKNRQAFETAHETDVVVMDKTGTLTEGDFKLNTFKSTVDSYNDEELLSLFASLEDSSSHPLAQGILDKAQDLELDIPKASDVESVSGVGMKGVINKKEALIVNEKYLKDNDYHYDKETIENLASKGNSMSFLIYGENLIGYVAQGDTIKKDAYKLIEKLHDQGVKTIMLTGDNEFFAKSIAKELKIDDYQAELLPEDKVDVIKDLKTTYDKVMMVGDGINDAPSLATSDVAVAIGAGTDIAIDSADIVLVQSNPLDITKLLHLSENTDKKMTQNIIWGAGYNFLAIPLAAGILAFAGIILTPAIGAILMSLSTVIVAINALLLKVN